MFAVISAILVFQEMVVFSLMAYKIKRACAPPKIRFLEKRYGGPNIDKHVKFMRSKF
jgi:hypothetical protein